MRKQTSTSFFAKECFFSSLGPKPAKFRPNSGKFRQIHTNSGEQVRKNQKIQKKSENSEKSIKNQTNSDKNQKFQKIDKNQKISQNQKTQTNSDRLRQTEHPYKLRKIRQMPTNSKTFLNLSEFLSDFV